ncbi:hypothetical protein PF005_g19164 [Phytophthora fragariae]|uniref:Uncharacterized protein n=1 Tax=Phytophthora fragariae TaxID=53985 RepID=A0A6A3WWY4_9STRA|nr:hypothetical protein PF006_g25896 [Phytophthora fragariae]KAE9100680.1 hypothetical protein PF007_g15410 [Phytophthora fragariae]KAE9179750.1 hypothetical protein PF004_g25055 [Phytophthora fragariae]KAE9190656.1 hypothetical protein PF005_g19164 [Phytophthora fragariae]KAE9217864.1 hypothetical protein PF002_g16664 [Phytophthora fragariae]
MSKPSSTILAARALDRRMGIAHANDPENSAGPSVEPPDVAAPAMTSSAAAPQSTPDQASLAPAPAPTTSHASKAMQPAHGSTPGASASHVQSSSSGSARLPAPQLSDIEGTALHGLLMDAADESTERLCAVFGSRLTEAVRCLVQVMIDPPRCQDHTRDCRIAEARSIPELVAAVQEPERSAFDTKAELKKKDRWLVRVAAENAELQKRLQASEDQRITSDNQIAAQQGGVEAHDEILAKTTARLKQADELLQSQAKKI